MSLEFDAATHTYRLGGVVVPSVTQVLNALGMTPTYPDVEFYRARGRAVHRATELFDSGKLKLVDERLLGYLDSWKAFLYATKFIPTLIEHRVVSETFQYAGTIDRYGTIGGDPALVDIKSGDIAPYAALQTAAYAHALAEDAIKVRRRLAVRLYEDGQPGRVKEYRDYGDQQQFLCALTVYKWKEKNV